MSGTAWPWWWVAAAAWLVVTVAVSALCERGRRRRGGSTACPRCGALVMGDVPTCRTCGAPGDLDETQWDAIDRAIQEDRKGTNVTIRTADTRRASRQD